MKIANPRVTMIAQTVPSSIGIEDRAVAASEWLEPQTGSSKAEYLTEFAGRACYQSFSRPNPATAKTEDYIQRTLFEQGHWSIAEHASVTFYITGVSRAFTHELIRHRHLSYSQLSQRFVDESNIEVVIPPALEYAYSNDIKSTVDVDYVAEAAQESYKSLVDSLLNRGLTRKQAREAARAVLPNMTETKIVVTGNLRAWHEFCERRMQPDADVEMQKVAGMIYEALRDCAPTIFPRTEEKAEEEKEPTEEEIRAAKLDTYSDGTIILVGGTSFVRDTRFWEDLKERILYTPDEVAAKGDFEILYQAV